MDVVLALLQSGVAGAMAWAGVRLTTHPPETVRAKRQYNLWFVVGGVVLAVLAVAQAYQNSRAATESTKLLGEARSEAREAKLETREVRRELLATTNQLSDLIARSTAAVLQQSPPQDRVLPDNVQMSIATALAATPVTYSVTALEGDSEAMKLAAQVCRVLKRAKWPSAVGCYGLAAYSGPIEGVWIWPTSERSRLAAAKLSRALLSSGILAKVTPDGFGATSETDGGLDIAIGRNTKRLLPSAAPRRTSLSGSRTLHDADGQ